MPDIKYHSDVKILSMLAHQDRMGWEYLYDKYSSSIFGVINSMAKNKCIAEDIFFDLFLHLKDNMEILLTQEARLCPYLMEETFIFGRDELKRKGLDADTSALGDTPKLIHLLCAKYGLPKSSTGAIDTANRDDT